MNTRQREMIKGMLNYITSISDNDNVYDDKNDRSFSIEEIKHAFPVTKTVDDDYEESICLNCGSDTVEYCTDELTWNTELQAFTNPNDYNIDPRCSSCHLNGNMTHTDAAFIKTRKDEESGLYCAIFDNFGFATIIPTIPHHRLPTREAAIRHVRNYIKSQH